MRFGILGPLFISTDEAARMPTAPKQRKLLALLLLNANQLVSVSECVEELWEYDPPASALATLQTYVMQLRRFLRTGAEPRLASMERLITRDRGYGIVTREGELDLAIYHDKLRQGQTALAMGDDRTAARVLRCALSLWRGSALSDVEPGPLLSIQLGGLEESRLGVLQQRIEADLRLGRHQELLGELSVLTRRQPLHENMHAQFMLALYRSGRQVDALQVFHRIRRVLADELGLSPSPVLQRLHEAMLSADPVLEAPAEAPPAIYSLI